MRAALGIATLVVLTASSCGGDDAPALVPARARTTITDASGAIVAVLTPRADGIGWHIEDASGAETGSLRVKDDRVSVKDAADRRTGKVQRRDDGFKIEDGDDRVLLRVQRQGDGYRLKRGETEILGRWRGAEIALGSGAPIQARAIQGGVTVQRGGAALYTIEGPVRPEAAVFLGLSEELSFEQRVAAMIFVREVSFQ